MQNSGYIGIVISAIIGGVVATAALDERHQSLERAMVTYSASEAGGLIESQLAEYVLITEGTRAALEADPNLSQDRYARVVERIVGEARGIINVAAAPDDTVEYVYPVEGNLAVLGLDLSSREVFVDAVMTARQTGRTVLSGPYDLVQGGRGLISRAVVANLDGDRGGPNSDWGIVSLVVNHQVVLDQAVLSGNAEALSLRVVDATDGRVLVAPDTVIENPVEVQISMAGIQWVLEAAPSSGWSSTSPDSHRLWMAITLLALCASAILFAFQKASRRQVRAERHLHEAVNAIDDGFAIYDADDRLIMCNDRYRELYAESAHAMVPGETFENILRAGLNEGQYYEALGREEEWLAQRLKAHREPGSTMEQQLPDGRWLRVTERKTASGHTVGFRVDISELKLALARSEAANAAKSVFLNNVSHELRTPMTVVLGFNAFIQNCDKLPAFIKARDALEAGDLPGAQRALDSLHSELKHFGIQIGRSGQQLVDLISSILDLSKVEEGQMNLAFEPVNLTDLAREVVEQFRPLAAKKRLELGVDGSPIFVTGDNLRLRQILINLLGNALKFTDEGRVDVRTGITGQKAWVEVTDTGHGIPADEQETIFERFVQLQAPSAGARGGVGLGLPISRELARLHGGSVSVRSKVGEGTTFRLELHLAADQKVAAE